MTTKDQALGIARDARTADEVERAMAVLAAQADDPEVDAVRAELSARLDAITAGLTPPMSRETSRSVDAARNPGANDW